MQQLGFVQGQLRQLENIKSSVIIESEPNTKLNSLLKLYKFSVLNNKKIFLISHTIPSFGLASVEGWFCVDLSEREPDFTFSFPFIPFSITVGPEALDVSFKLSAIKQTNIHKLQNRRSKAFSEFEIKESFLIYLREY